MNRYALLWMVASLRKVDFDPEQRDEVGMSPMAITEVGGGRTTDVLRTAAMQTYWNGWAATAAAVAAAANAVALMAYPSP
jgi:hypothetical protein